MTQCSVRRGPAACRPPPQTATSAPDARCGGPHSYRPSPPTATSSPLAQCPVAKRLEEDREDHRAAGQPARTRSPASLPTFARLTPLSATPCPALPLRYLRYARLVPPTYSGHALWRRPFEGACLAVNGSTAWTLWPYGLHVLGLPLLFVDGAPCCPAAYPSPLSPPCPAWTHSACKQVPGHMRAIEVYTDSPFLTPNARGDRPWTIGVRGRRPCLLHAAGSVQGVCRGVRLCRL